MACGLRTQENVCSVVTNISHSFRGKLRGHVSVVTCATWDCDFTFLGFCFPITTLAHKVMMRVKRLILCENWSTKQACHRMHVSMYCITVIMTALRVKMGAKSVKVYRLF